MKLKFEDTKTSVSGSRDDKALTAVKATAEGESAQVAIHVKLNETELSFEGGRAEANLKTVGITPGSDAETGTNLPFKAWFQGIEAGDPVAGNFKGQMTLSFEYL